MQKIDIHSHVLPGIDDGSRNLEESRALLTLLRQQGIQTLAATPHFYAEQQNPNRFFQRRNEAWEHLETQRDKHMPKILLGAEVLYFSGISMLDRLEDFRIEGTPLLLLEMPFVPWSKRNIQELLSIHHTAGFTVVLAHIERYLSFQKQETWDELYSNGVLYQINADSLLNWRSKGKMLKLLKQKRVHFIASDCHNIERRPPKLESAWKQVQTKTSEEVTHFLMETENRYFPTRDVVQL